MSQDSKTLKQRAEEALMPVFPIQPVTLTHGQGCTVYDNNGKAYLDFLAGVAVNALGYAHPKQVAAAQEQAAKAFHFPASFLTEQKVRLAELLIENCCQDQVFFCNSGAEAIEAALKLARKWAQDTKGPDCPDCHEIISFERAFHGRTFGALSVTQSAGANRQFFEPLLPGIKSAVFNDIESVKAVISTERTAAIILEPLQAEGGVYPADPEFLKELRELATQHDVAIIVDEVQTGMGRLGTLFAHAYFDLEPDMVVLAKGLGGGVPIGALLAKRKFSEHFTVGSHGSTYSGNPFVTHVAATVVETLLEDGFLENVKAVGTHLQEGLQNLSEKTDVIKDVRGIGMLVGAELTVPVKDVVVACWEASLLVTLAGNNTLRLIPPLILTKDEADQGLEIIGKVLQDF